MTPVERIEYMLNMKSQLPEKDDAGIYIARGIDTGIEIKQIKECLKVLKSEEVKDRIIT